MLPTGSLAAPCLKSFDAALKPRSHENPDQQGRSAHCVHRPGEQAADSQPDDSGGYVAPVHPRTCSVYSSTNTENGPVPRDGLSALVHAW